MMRHPLSLAAALVLCALPLTACGASSQAQQTSQTATTSPTAPQLGEGIFASPDDADRADADSTAEVAALMLHSWDTTTDRTETAAAIRTKPLMSADWAAHQVEPERNAGGAPWIAAAQHQGYSVPSIIPAPGDVSRDVAPDKAIRAYTVEWTWTTRDGATIHDTGRRQITLYLEEHDGQWSVVGHQSRAMGEAR
ncbi:hypothetical protein ACH9EU_08375 [Kocuria sp. M1R5S2]|uniref:hypothetical protein n=1 Tax=Kocuria rhizosphaerae TaxID=3376285 RepID=UPI0037B4C302